MSEANAAAEMMREHDRKMEALLDKFLGKEQMRHGRSLEDRFVRKQWFANRVAQLALWEGQNSMRMRRCKSADSERYKQYEEHEQELRQARDALILELVMID